MQSARFFLLWLRRSEQAVCFIAFAIMALALMGDVLARELRGTGFFGSAQIGVFGLAIVIAVPQLSLFLLQ